MNYKDRPIVAQSKKRGTKYVAVKAGINPSYSIVTTAAGSKYVVRTDSIEMKGESNPN
jgi:hypothetical protein